MAVNRSLLESLCMTALAGALAYGAIALRDGRDEGPGGSSSALAALAWLSMGIIAALTLRSVFEGTRRGEYGAFAMLAAQAVLLVWLLFRLIE